MSSSKLMLGRAGYRKSGRRAAPLRRPPALPPEAWQERLSALELEVTALQCRLEESEFEANSLRHGREFYQELFDWLPVGYVVMNQSGLVQEANQQLAWMLNPKRGEPVAGSFLQFVDKKRVSTFLNHLRQANLFNKLVRTDVVLRTTEGQELPVQLITGPACTAQGLKLFRTVVLDISEQKAAQDALALTQHDFQALVDTVRGLVWEAEPNSLQITFISRSGQAILGYPPALWYQRGFWLDHIHADDRDRVANAIAWLNLRGTPERSAPGTPAHGPDFESQARGRGRTRPDLSGSTELEFRMIAADRRLVWLHSTVTLRGSRSGPKLFGVAVEITQRKLAEENLQRASEQLEKRVEDRTAELRDTVSQLEAFSYSLSHDMRAPLRSIHSFCELLREGLIDKLNPQQRELFDRIMSSTRRLDALIQDVLLYGKVSRAPLELKPINLDALVDTVLRDYPQIKAPGAQIEVQKPLLTVLGHEAFLTQCLSNLLSNAVKFVPPGQKPRVRVRTEAIEPDVRLWVEDCGIGISREHQKRVFSIFQRVHDPGLYEGTGIGLAVVQKAVERMGGHVGVESIPGQGSKFWLQLHAGAA